MQRRQQGSGWYECGMPRPFRRGWLLLLRNPDETDQEAYEHGYRAAASAGHAEKAVLFFSAVSAVGC